MSTKDKFKTAGLCVLFLLIGLGIGTGIGWWWCNHSAVPDFPDAVVITPISKPVPGQPFFLTVDDLRYYDEALKFMVTTTAPGKAEVAIKRPPQWYPPRHLLIIGLGGGFHCGNWLPGGTLAYLHRVGGLGRFSVFLGPELAVSAMDARTIDIAVYGKAALVW